MLGDMSGQLGAVVRTVDIMAVEVRQMSKDIAATSHMQGDVAELKQRVAALELKEGTRNGGDQWKAAFARAVPWAAIVGAIGIIAKWLGVGS